MALSFIVWAAHTALIVAASQQSRQIAGTRIMPVRTTRLTRAAVLLAASCASTASPRAADRLTAEQVRALVQAAPAGGVDLQGRDLSGDDLSGLDLTGAKLAGANLSGANLHGVKLTGADLTGTDLSNADLTFAWIIRANFSRATLHGATLQTIVTSKAMDNTADQAANFAGADLSGIKATVHFSFDNLHGADFRHAQMSAVIANQSMGLLRTEFMSCDLDGANFEGAGLGHNLFRFAKLRGANFRGADLTAADFTGAYLDNADFTGAKLDSATFKGATLTGVKGLNRPVGSSGD
jgi:uncharacterized protein YjbI with pentapeptide repeats